MPTNKPHGVTLLAGAVLVTWACAKGNEPDNGSSVQAPSAGGSGATGGSAQGGSGGASSGGTGGSVMTSGGTGGVGGGTGGVGGGTGGSAAGSKSETGGAGGAGGGTGGSVATGGSVGTGGSVATGGDTGTGGSVATGGTGGTVATGGTGGTVGDGGRSTGGSSGKGSSSGGMGVAGFTSDPNFKPPDMSKAKLIVYYQAQQNMAMTYSIGMMLQIKNTTDAPYDLGKVTIRYWFTSEAAPMPRFDYTATGLSASGSPTFFGNASNPYIELKFKAGGTVPVYVDQNSLNNTNMSVAVQAQSNTGQFNQGNDWSFDSTASAYKINPKITVYDNGTLIFGCEPSRLCADTTDMGMAGAPAM
jgi:hypothetical protein